MKTYPFFRITLFFAIILIWLLILVNDFQKDMIIFFLISGPILFVLFSILGNYLLKKFPEKVYLVNLLIHYSVLLVLGISAIISLKETTFWENDFKFPVEISLILMLLFGVFCMLSVINLAISGLGAPFAISLTERISQSFLYKYSRNPMVLSTIFLFIAIGLYYNSIYFILWVIILVFPSFIVFLIFYEEKELQIRFGEKYSTYKNHTPRFLRIFK